VQPSGGLGWRSLVAPQSDCDRPVLFVDLGTVSEANRDASQTADESLTDSIAGEPKLSGKTSLASAPVTREARKNLILQRR
jgi:hypothetical protein